MHMQDFENRCSFYFLIRPKFNFFVIISKSVWCKPNMVNQQKIAHHSSPRSLVVAAPCCWGVAVPGRFLKFKGQTEPAVYKRNGSSKTTTSNIKPKITQVHLQNNSVNVLEWPSQCSDLNPAQNLWQKIAFHSHSWNLLYRNGSERLKSTVSTRAKLILSYPHRDFWI